MAGGIFAGEIFCARKKILMYFCIASSWWAKHWVTKLNIQNCVQLGVPKTTIWASGLPVFFLLARKNCLIYAD